MPLRRASVPARLKRVVRGRTTYEECSPRSAHPINMDGVVGCVSRTIFYCWRLQRDNLPKGGLRISPFLPPSIGRNRTGARKTSHTRPKAERVSRSRRVRITHRDLYEEVLASEGVGAWCEFRRSVAPGHEWARQYHRLPAETACALWRLGAFAAVAWRELPLAVEGSRVCPSSLPHAMRSGSVRRLCGCRGDHDQD